MSPRKAPGIVPALKAIRERLGLNQNDVATAAGVTQGQFSNLELGINQPAGLRTAHAIARALGVDVFDIWPHLKPTGVRRAKASKSMKGKG